MVDAVAFRTRARTIDHLGREQIADCPTAVSELWKNAYDAYAGEVSLHIFGGDVPIAGIFDDGHGMRRDEFESKWLVIGTESKAIETEVSLGDRNGLPYRPKQGQKGIGRLSSANLGSLLLLVSKRKADFFVASLIDWRLFENPFIYLQDVEIPIVEFSKKDELWRHLPVLFDRMMGNVWGTGKNSQRDERIAQAWNSFDVLEERSGRGRSTRRAIEESLLETTFTERHVENWALWNGTKASGTAMVMAHISFDLQAQLQSVAAETEKEAVKQARDKLTQTLVNFIDPFASPDGLQQEWGVEDFSYSATVWDGELRREIIASERAFTYQNLLELEHVLEGSVDVNGIFVGRVKAFGAWLEGQITIAPTSPVPVRSDATVGPFHIRMGTFEQNLANSTHSEAVHAQYVAQVEEFGGFMVFRNGLRVMPYGRANNDFFEIDQRRSTNAGREFWANRRLFGRISLSRDDNPNLRDKAGREGIIDNKAAKVFRDVVINVLMTSARRYFGSASDIRHERLPEIQKDRERQRAEEAQRKVRARKRKEFRRNLENFLPKIRAVEGELLELARRAEESALPKEEEALVELHKRVSELKAQRGEMGLGNPPRNLAAIEADYQDFRRASSSANELITRVSSSISHALESAKPMSAREAAYAELSRNAAHLHGRLRRWSSEAKEILNSEIGRVTELVDERNQRYHVRTLPLLEELEHRRMSLPSVLGQLGSERDAQDRENAEMFEPYISTLRSLQELVDIETLVNFTMNESAELRGDLERLNSLAQLGITVEIIGHEMEGLEMTVSRGLDELPQSVKATRTFKAIQTAHQTLIEKLRFLSPLKLSGERNRLWLTGERILEYVQSFIGDSLRARHILLEATQAFRLFSVYEQPARIYPVFINLVNNAAYWVDQNTTTPKRVMLDIAHGKVFVADNGPGVEEDDRKHLFTLFFTRKIRGGRGVGLYLCRANLAAGGHTVDYVAEDKQKLLPGANFVIDLKGAKYE